MDLLALSDDPRATLDRLWRDLAAGVVDRRSSYHTPTLATVDADGAAAARTVVLRLADAATRTVACHTRRDAPKVAEVRGHERVAWHVYDREAKVQLVASGAARIEATSPLADERWAATGEGSRACYRRVAAPGGDWSDDVAAESGDGRGRFAVLACVIDKVDWLFLHHAGHVRWRFAWQAGEWQSRRVAP